MGFNELLQLITKISGTWKQQGNHMFGMAEVVQVLVKKATSLASLAYREWLCGFIHHDSHDPSNALKAAISFEGMWHRLGVELDLMWSNSYLTHPCPLAIR